MAIRFKCLRIERPEVAQMLENSNIYLDKHRSPFDMTVQEAATGLYDIEVVIPFCVMYVIMCVCTYVRSNLCVSFVCMQISMCVCVCVYIYTHIHNIHTHKDIRFPVYTAYTRIHTRTQIFCYTIGL